MAHYSIKELEHLSGIKAHTLRIWEQRYQLLQPKRTETNIRFYDDADLKNLLNVTLLYQQGYKISRIAQLAPQQIAQEVLSLTQADLGQDQFINQLIISMVELNEVLFERTLSKAVLQLGFADAVGQVVYPFLHKIGLLWQTANITPAHEHFMSQLIRQKMLVALDALPIPSPTEAPKVILALPEGELHELSLLYAHYLFRSSGFATLYLGQHLPLQDLIKASQQYKPDYIFTAFTSVSLKCTIPEYLTELAAGACVKKVLVCGALLQHCALQDLPAKVMVVSSIEEHVAWLKVTAPSKVRLQFFPA